MSKKIYYYEDGRNNYLSTFEYLDFKRNYSNDIVIVGNKNFSGFNESWLDSDFSIRDFNAKDFNDYFTYLTGKEWDAEVYCMAGCSQEEWQYVIFNKNALDLETIKYLEGIYFGTYYEIDIKDDNEVLLDYMFVKDLYSDTLAKAVGTSDYELYKYVEQQPLVPVRVG